VLTYRNKESGPKALIKHFYNNITLKGALIFILITIILDLLFFLFIKAPNYGIIVFNTFWSKLIVSWLLLGFIFYIITYFIKGKSNLPSNLYKKILCGLAAFRVPFIVYIVISTAIELIFFPSFLKIMANVVNRPELLQSQSFLPAITTVNVIGGILFFILTLFILVYVLIMWYYFIKELLKTRSFLPTFLWSIIYLIIGVLITSLL
jgi:hypothetical protein